MSGRSRRRTPDAVTRTSPASRSARDGARRSAACRAPGCCRPRGGRTVGTWCFTDLILPSDGLDPDPLEFGPHPGRDRYEITDAWGAWQHHDDDRIGPVASRLDRMDAPAPPRVGGR